MSKIQYSDTEKLLIKIDKLMKSKLICDSDLNFMCSITSFYMVNKYLTPKQVYAANKVVNKYKIKKKVSVKKKYNLYAISNGDSIKLGFSSNIKSRVKALQTGSDGDLKLLWKYYAGTNLQAAKDAERKLHRYCNEFRIRGEWFKSECIDKVMNFKV